jgi:hypothetical protein
MSKNIDKTKQQEEEEIEVVNWPVVFPLLLVMVGIIVTAFILATA